MRKTVFANGEFYHIFNRGVDKRKIFLRHGHYKRFLETIENLLFTGTAQTRIITRQSLAFDQKLSLLCYCLMPNHYHLVLKQNEEKAISDFMHGLNTSYTKYFNLNNERTGRLFEYTFKAVYVESEEQLIHLSRYIHLNPLVANLVSDLEDYPWSSYLESIGVSRERICKTSEILSLLGEENHQNKYKTFVKDQVDYVKKLESIKNLILE